MSKNLTLFFIIFLEGYVVLSAELLAIRLLIPFTGSGTDTVSIIISAVLMPLAFGYYAGGRYKSRREGAQRVTIRRKLLLNLATAAVFLTAGLSYAVIQGLDSVALDVFHINNRLVLTSLYAAIFIVYPVFLLGQTVPLISNFFPGGRLPSLAGKILFISTLGSFMGAVFCTLVLMPFLGVHYSVIVTIAFLTLPAILLSRRKTAPEPVVATLCLVGAILLNNGIVMDHYGVVANNRYHTIRLTEYGNNRMLRINNNASAEINENTGESTFSYVRFIERTLLDPLNWNAGDARDILVIGAGGFTLGVSDDRNNYVYVDLDAELQDVAEKHFLRRKLAPNKQFIAIEGRAYLARADRQFDLIVVDAFHGPSYTPEHLVTREFFQQVKDSLKPDGIMVANFIVSPNLNDNFSMIIDNTIRSVFGIVTRQSVDEFNAWSKRPEWDNVLYYAYNRDPMTAIYTDDRNTSVYDKLP